MVSMRQAALHDGQWMVLLVQLRTAPDCGFPVALYEDDPAQTVSQHGISLPAAHTRVAPVPAVLALVRSAAASVLIGCANRPCACAAHFLPMVHSLWGTAVVTALV